ncbi:MAG: hypothetical protein JRF63_14400 [Deltaproteobacteria bacterium]|nr:hypothetical protein [Deltaproteobacteria bacterium]
MNKIIVVLWVALMGTVAGGVITYVKLSGTIDELETTAEDQRTELAELSDAVGRMSQVVRQVVTLSSLRADEDTPLEQVERPRVRATDGSLEAQVDELNDLISPYKELMDRELRRKEQRAAARARADLDKERFGEEELDEINELYRGGRGRWGSEERRENLEELVEKYPEASMAGCALIQLAYGIPAEEAESYYLKAIQGHGDSYCFGGTQVGAIARDRLADHYEKTDQNAKAQGLRAEIKSEFPGAVDHHGDPL